MKTKVREKPIIFDGESVRAILAGAKTQTRRVVKPQPMQLDTDQWFPGPPGDRRNAKHYANERHLRKGLPIDFCPYPVGTRLWVRETWRPEREEGTGTRIIRYRADGHAECDGWPGDQHDGVMDGTDRWRSPSHMPMWAARLSLEVVDVRDVIRMEGEYYLYGDEITEGGLVTATKVINPWAWDFEFKRVEAKQ